MALLLAFLLLLMSYGAGSATVNHGNSTDMLSLLDFKAAISDPKDALRSWDRNNHYCNWTGVSCSSMSPGRVDALELPGESLSGEITPSLGNLTFLKILNLSSNGFSGHLPHLNQLQELVVLDLSNNSFHGIIPDPIMNCSNLNVVGLSSNMLEGSIPMKIGSLYNLIAIDLSWNNLTGVIPPSINNATQLEFLVLDENKLGGRIPAAIGQLPQLFRLGLSYNNLQGVIP